MSRALTFMLLAAFALTGCSKPAGLDVSGVWTGDITSEYITAPLRLELSQTGQMLTGTATSTTLAETVTLDNLSGKVNAPQITLSFSYNLGSIGGSDELIVRYAFVGTVSGNTLAGDVSVSIDGGGPPVPGTFELQKQP